MWEYTDVVTYTKLYDKDCQYLIQTNHLSITESLTPPTSVQQLTLSDQQVSN